MNIEEDLGSPTLSNRSKLSDAEVIIRESQGNGTRNGTQHSSIMSSSMCAPTASKLKPIHETGFD